MDDRYAGSDSPVTGDQATVPGEQRLRRDEEGGPAQAGQEASSGGQEDAIGRPQVRPACLAAEDGNLELAEVPDRPVEHRGGGVAALITMLLDVGVAAVIVDHAVQVDVADPSPLLGPRAALA